MESEEFDKTLCGQSRKLNESLHKLCIYLTPKFIRKWIDKDDIKNYLIMKEKRKQEYLKRMLEEVGNEDIEISHINADNILCDILKEVGGFDEILKAYEKVEKWFS